MLDGVGAAARDFLVEICAQVTLLMIRLRVKRLLRVEAISLFRIFCSMSLVASNAVHQTFHAPLYHHADGTLVLAYEPAGIGNSLRIRRMTPAGPGIALKKCADFIAHLRIQTGIYSKMLIEPLHQKMPIIFGQQRGRESHVATSALVLPQGAGLTRLPHILGGKRTLTCNQYGDRGRTLNGRFCSKYKFVHISFTEFAISIHIIDKTLNLP